MYYWGTCCGCGVITHKHSKKCMFKVKLSDYQQTFWRRKPNMYEYYCKLCYYREWKLVKGYVQIKGVVLWSVYVIVVDQLLICGVRRVKLLSVISVILLIMRGNMRGLWLKLGMWCCELWWLQNIYENILEMW